MKKLYKLSANQSFVFFFLVPFTLEILLFLCSILISFKFMPFFVEGLLLPILFRYYYFFMLGFYLKKTDNNISISSFNKFRFASFFMIIYTFIVLVWFASILFLDRIPTTIEFLLLIPGIPGLFMQHRIENYLADRITETEFEIMGQKNDHSKLRVMLAFPLWYNWILFPRINRIFDSQ
jgi:hypothetical protein